MSKLSEVAMAKRRKSEPLPLQAVVEVPRRWSLDLPRQRRAYVPCNVGHHEPKPHRQFDRPLKPDTCALGIVDEGLLAEQVAEWTSGKCPGCDRKGQGLKHVGSTVRGIGAGSIDFECGGCGETRCLQRSRSIKPTTGTSGATLSLNTELVVGAMDKAGMGYSLFPCLSNCAEN